MQLLTFIGFCSLIIIANLFLYALIAIFIGAFRDIFKVKIGDKEY